MTSSEGTTEPNLEIGKAYINADISKKERANIHMQFTDIKIHKGYHVVGKFEGGTMTCIATQHGEEWLLFGMYKEADGNEQAVELVFFMVNNQLKVNLGLSLIHI